MVQVRADEDGTHALLLDGKVAMTGLTRAQADKLADSFRARREREAVASSERASADAKPPPRRWRDWLARRRSAR